MSVNPSAHPASPRRILVVDDDATAKVVGRIASPNVQRALLFTRLNTQMTLVMAA